jgi:tRNA modification GTPase
MEESFGYGRVLREGFRLAIVGRPNAGKSSLFNRLVGRDRAIVTAQPGTTRDPVAERVEMAGIPVELVDTAGLRATDDEAEGMGVAKSREAMAEADVVVLVVAADAAFDEEDKAVVAGAVGRKLILVVNKVDLVEAISADRFATGFVGTSAVVGTGIEELRGAILEAIGGAAGVGDTVPVTNLRQQGAIQGALAAMRSAERGLVEGMPHEMLLLDLHEGLGALDELTGTTHTEEILGVIFGSFCIGK